MAVSTNPLLFITECSKELTNEIADEKYSLDSCKYHDGACKIFSL